MCAESWTTTWRATPSTPTHTLPTWATPPGMEAAKACTPSEAIRKQTEKHYFVIAESN